MQTQITSIGTFIGGLNTEQPQLADQIQYTTDELNCQLLPDGTRARRYGLTREENSVGIPMSYTSKDWVKQSAQYSQDLVDNDIDVTDTFSFDIVIDDYGTTCTPVAFIQDGDDSSYAWKFEANTISLETTWQLALYKNSAPIVTNILKSTSVPNDYTHFRIKVLPLPSDVTQMIVALYAVENDQEEYRSANVINPGSDFVFSNSINVLGEVFTTDGSGIFTISNVKFLKDNATVLTTTDVAEEESFVIEYTEPAPSYKPSKDWLPSGTGYKIVLPETTLYTVTLVGAGSYEGWYQGSRGSTPNWGFTAQGAAGAGVTFSAVLEAGEYSVDVGRFYGFNQRSEGKHHGYFRTGGSTYIRREGVIDIKATGGSGQGFYPKNGYYEGPEEAYSGTLEVVLPPDDFTIIKRSPGHQLHYENSFLTGDTTGYGAINKGGYFRIVKGYEAINPIEISKQAVTSYYWANYDKEGADCIVVQIGSLLKFYKANRPYDGELITTVNTVSQIKNGELFERYQFSSGEGYLLCTSEYAEPFYIKLNKESNYASMVPVTLQIRDLFGLEDYLEVDEKPSTLTKEHKYNLFNQGWENENIDEYHTEEGVYPSNNLIWWYGKDANDDFDAAQLTKQYFGTTPAPRGHYILDFFNQDRTSVSGIADLETVVKDRYCVSSEFFAGRFFYLASSTVLFSQIIREDIRGIGKCYQEADPTSQKISDLIATDGGQIIFQDLGYGKKIKKFPLGLLVFGTKSIYAITSTSSNTFNATQYLTQFVTSAGCLCGASVVGAEDVVYYWSPQGIYQIAVDQVSGTQAIASSLSSNTIQQWYNNLPNFSKENCIGAYDYTNRRIIWLYPTDENNLENRNGVLVYYLDFKAFLPSKISDGGELITVFETIHPTYIVPSIALFAGDYEVVANTTDVIVKDFGQEYGRNFSVCYLGYIKNYDRLFFCDFYSRDFIDWQTSYYDSYAVSYPITFGSTWQKQYTPTLQCYYLRTEEDELTNGQYLAPSSCYLSSRWKWAETQESDRWDMKQESYIHIPRFMEFKYVNGKIRVRGSGPAVQYKIESREDNDFKLSGLNMQIRTVV